MKNCEYYQELISAFIDEELDHATRADVIAHMTECEKCRKVFQFYRELHFSSETLIVTPPTEVSQSVLQRIGAIKRTSRLRKALPYMFAPVAAALIIVVAVSTYNNQEKPSENDYLAAATQGNITSTARTRQAESAPSGGGVVDEEGIVEDATVDDTGASKKQTTQSKQPAEVIAEVSEAPPQASPYSEVQQITSNTTVLFGGGASDTVEEPIVIVETPEVEENIAEQTPITMMSVGDLEGISSRMFTFVTPAALPVWTEDGRLDLSAVGEISFIVVTEGDDSHAEQSQEGIQSIAEQFMRYELTPAEAHEPIDSSVIRYTLNFADGSIMNISLYDTDHCIECDGTWYTIDNAEGLPAPFTPPDDDEKTGEELAEETSEELEIAEEVINFIPATEE